MSSLSLVLAVLVPALLLLAYGLIKTQRTLLREALWAGFVGGIVVAIAVVAWEVALDWLLPLSALPPAADAAGRALLIAALPEEGFKFAALLLVVHRFVYLGDVPDVILASLGVALGFAVIEDAAYVIPATSASATAGGVVAVVRALTAVPVHAVCGLTMGALLLAVARSIYVEPEGLAWRLAPALLVPMLMHGAYDFLLMLHRRDPLQAWALQGLPLVLAISVGLAIILCNRILRRERGMHSGPMSGTAAPAALGAFLLLIGLAFVLVTLLAPDVLLKQTLAVYCVVPLLFGLDLLWTALVRMRRRTWA